MSLASILSIARSALVAQQRTIDTISHNIANASTPGYTRQETPLGSSDPLRTPQGAVGTGVTIEAARRMRDSFLDTTFRQESGLQGQYSATRDLLGQVQQVLGEPGTSGLSTSLGAFFDAFSQLATDPGNATNRFVTRQTAQSLVQRFRSLDGALSQTAQNASAQLQDKVSQSNQLLQQVVDLNGQILAAKGSGGIPDLEDRRDVALDKLSTLLGIRTVAYQDGTVGVIAGDTVVADGAGHQTLTVSPVGSGYGVTLGGSSTVVQLSGGEVKALTDFTQTTVPGIRSQLDQLAGAIVSSINTLHQGGTVSGSTPPVTGVPLFDPAGVTAGSIDLSAQVKASASNIVTGTTGQAGDGTIALQIAQLRQTQLTALGGLSAPEFYTGVVSAIGGLGQTAEQSATAQGTLVANLDAQRSSADGVNTDEEMIALIKGQQAYSAAARIITVADDMMQDLLRMI